MCDLNQTGLEWHQGMFGLEPRWSREPDIDVIRQIARERLCNSDTTALSVAFYSQGAFNKLYLVSVSQSSNIVPTERELKGFDLTNDELQELVAQAQRGDEADRQLTIRQALKHYKTPVFWAMFLSTSLIMEGFDLVTVRLG